MVLGRHLCYTTAITFSIKYMHEPTYRQAFKEAWCLTWHNKLLWILGLLSVLVGQLGINNFIGQLTVSNSPALQLILGIVRSVAHGTYSVTVWSVWLLVIVVVLGAALVLVTVAAQGALIGAVTAWYRHKKLDITAAWHKGVRHFWRLLLLNVVEKIVLAGLFFSIAYIGAGLNLDGYTSDMALFILSLAAALFVAFVVTTVSVYAAGYIVEEELPWLQALARAWQLFHDHLLVSLELSLLLLLSALGIVLLVLMVSVWVLVPSVLFTVAAGFTGILALIGVGVVVTNIVFILFVVFVGAIYNTFVTSAWMYLFMKMHHEGVGSRILGWFKRS